MAYLVLFNHAPRNATNLADDDSEVASEAEAPSHEKEKKLFDKSSEVVTHSAEQVDKLIIETQEHAVSGNLLPSATLAVVGAFVFVCTLVMGMWLLKRRRKWEPATPQTPPDAKHGSSTPTAVTSDTEPSECYTPAPEMSEVVVTPQRPQSVPPIVTSKTSARSPSRNVTIQRSGSVESCHDRSSSSAWTSMFLRMTSDPREHKNGNQCDEPYGRMVEVMTPRQSAGDNSFQSSAGTATGRWRSVLVTRLRQLKPRKYRTHAAMAPTQCYV